MSTRRWTWLLAVLAWGLGCWSDHAAAQRQEAYLGQIEPVEVEVWSPPGAATQEFQPVAKFEDPAEDCVAMEFSPDAQALLLASREGKLTYWSIRDQKFVWSVQPDELRDICAVKISPDGKTALIGLEDGRLMGLDVVSGKLVFTIGEQGQAPPRQIGFSANPRVAVVVTDYGHVIWDLSTLQGRELHNARYSGPRVDPETQPEPTCLVVGPKALPFFVGNSAGSLYRVDFGGPIDLSNDPSLRFRIDLRVSHSAPAYDRYPRPVAACLDAKGQLVFFAMADGTVVIERGLAPPAGPDTNAVRMSGQRTPARAIAPLARDSQIAVYGGGQSLDVWWLSEGQIYPIARFRDPDVKNVRRVALHGRAGLAASRYDDGTVKVQRLPDVGPENVIARQEFFNQLLLFRTTHSFDQIQKELQRLLQEKSHGGDGSNILWKALMYLSTPPKSTGEDWETHLKVLEKWAENRPKSVEPQLCLAYAYIQYGWAARGSGWANEVTEEGAKLFHERVMTAADYLITAQDLDAKHPAVYAMQIEVAKALGLSKQETVKIFRRGLAADPAFEPLYEEMAEYLLPRWHGQLGDLGKFAQALLRQLGPELGPVMVARFADCVGRYHDVGDFSALGFDWQPILDGALKLREQYPIAPAFSSLACAAAAYEGQRELAREMFSEFATGGVGHWSDQEKFHRLRAWACWEDPSQQTAMQLVSESGVHNLVVSADGQVTATVLGDLAQLVSIMRKGDPRTDVLPHPFAIVDIALSADGTRLASAGLVSEEEGLVGLWDLAEERVEWLEGASTPMIAVTFSPDESKVAAASSDGKVLVWNVGETSPAMEITAPSTVLVLEFDQSSTHLAMGTDQGEALLWNLEQNKSVRNFEHSAPITAITRAGEQFVLATQGHELLLWKSGEGPTLMTIPETMRWKYAEGNEGEMVEYISHLAIDPDAHLVYAAYNVDTESGWRALHDIHAWSLKDGSHRGRIRAHGMSITGLVVLPGNAGLITSSADGTVRQWWKTAFAEPQP